MTRVVGQGNALYLIESGERIGARRAYEMGLVQEVAPAGRALARALELAERIASYPQRSLLADRRAVLETWGRSLDDGLALESRLGLAAADDPELVDGTRSFERRERG
jgi:enoyl-CoA hydratase